MNRLLIIPLALVLLLAGAMAWSRGGATQRADFAFINRGDIITLDLNQMSYLQDFRVTYGIREGLFTHEPRTLKPVYAGAVQHDVSEDKRVWTFQLRPECQWTSGDPVTAHDYVFAWRRMLEEPGEYTYLFYYIRNARAYEESFAADGPMTFEEVGIQAIDAHTLRITLNDPVPFLMDLLAFPIFYPLHEPSMARFRFTHPETGRTSYRPEFTRPPHVVTNGPFELVDWQFKRRLFFDKSDTYWDRENVRLTSIEMVVNEKPLSQFLQYEAGGVDWLASIDADLGAELRQQGRPDLKTTPAFGTSFLTFNCLPAFLPGTVGIAGKNPLADKRVRQALAMSINKQFIVDNITRMGEQPTSNFVPPGTLDGYRSSPGVPHDVQRARALLVEAGYPGGRGLPVLPLLFNTASATSRKLCESLQSQWRSELGVQVDLQGIEVKQYRDRITNKRYAIAPVGWYGDYPDASTFTDKYLSTSNQNDTGWAHQQYDHLCHLATKEPDPGKRLRLLEQAEQILISDELPIAPIYTYVNAWMHRDNVHGIHANPKMLTMFKSVWVEK
jgi:oligopeptide transport system substrate-binding protein